MSDTATLRPSAGSIRRTLVWGVAVFLVTAAVFVRLIACDFTWWDDPDTIHHNPLLNPPTLASLRHYWVAAGPDAPMGLYIPATYTVWLALAAMARLPAPRDGDIWLNPHVFHAANVLLHALTAVAAFALLRRLLRRDWPAAAGALLLALHPVQVEPVAWASGTKDVLCGLLSILALWQYVAAIDAQIPAALPRVLPPPPTTCKPHLLRWMLATVLFVLAILSKPTAVALPLMAMSIDRLLLQRSWRSVLAALWPWLAIAAAAAAVAQWSQKAPWSSPLPAWDRPLIAADALAFYLWKLVWPARLCPDYGHRPVAVLASGWVYFTWILPAAVPTLLVVLRRRWPIGVLSGGLMFLPLLPVLGFVGFDFQFFSTTADHYLYLAMLGPALLLGWALQAWPGKRSAALAAVVLAALAVRTALQEPVWQDTRSLFEHTLAVNPASFTAADLLGFYHDRQSQQLAAMAAAANRGGDAEKALALGAASRQQLLVALRYYEQTLNIYPQYVPALVSLANVHRALGDPATARQDIHRVLMLQPQTLPAFRADPLGLAAKLIEFGDSAEALPILDRLLHDHPYDRDALRLRAAAEAATGRSTSDKSATAPDPNGRR